MRGENPPGGGRTRGSLAALITVLAIAAIGIGFSLLHHPARQPAIVGHDYAPGECLYWSQSASNAALGHPTVVPCSQAHLVEIVSSGLAITGEGPAWPGSKALDTYARSHCLGPAEAYLGHPLDPGSRFVTAGVTPTEAAWTNGDRTLYCDLQLATRPGAPTLPAFTGEVRGAAPTPGT
jgi:hypothetical protein